MKIYVANLREYNEGNLVGTWVDLPIVDMKEEVYDKIFSPEELDENGNPKGDYAIHDYELPFEISEQENINVLNEMAEIIMNDVDSKTLDSIIRGNYDTNDVINLVRSLGVEDAINNYVHENEVIRSVQEEAEEGNLLLIKSKLKHITDLQLNNEYFIIDGYENYHTIKDEDLKSTIDIAFKMLREFV